MADLVMPKLGLTMTEGTLTEWHVAPGQGFARGTPLFTVETEKVANEIEAESDGTIAEILVPAGQTVPVGTPVARLAGAGAPAAAAPAAAAAAGDAGQGGAGQGGAAVTQAPAAPTAPSAPAAGGAPQGRVVATPLARRLAREAGVDLAAVAGSGPAGRIKAEDVRRAAEAGPAAPAAAPAREPAPATEIMPDAVRLATARRVSAATRDIPHFHVMREAEVSALAALRETLNAEPGRPRISVTHMLIRAFGIALAEMAQMNRIWLDDRILAFSQVDVGMVTQTPAGLRIPVLRDVANADLDAIARSAAALAGRAREGRLAAADVGGGVASVSNVGMFGATAVAPIISPPQAMILGVGAERALFRPDASGAPALRREIALTLVCDHRIIDGSEAARLLDLLVSLVENPIRLLRPARRPDILQDQE